MLYDAQNVAVVGAGNSAGQAAMYLAECCPDRTVHLLVRRRLGPGMSDYLVGRIRAKANISVHEGVEISGVHGERRLESITLRTFNANDAAESANEPIERLPIAALLFSSAPTRVVPGCPKPSRATSLVIF